MYLLILLLSYLIQSTKIELSSDDFCFEDEQYLVSTTEEIISESPKVSTTEEILSESPKVSTTIDDNQELLWIVLKFFTAADVVLISIYFSM